ANQQLLVAEEGWPATPRSVDAQRATAWLRRQIMFENEPLERVAGEFNRYASKLATEIPRTRGRSASCARGTGNMATCRHDRRASAAPRRAQRADGATEGHPGSDARVPGSQGHATLP